MNYCAIIGDIVSSKSLTNRYEVQEQFKHVLKETNDRFDDVIASRFMLTLGDEFQGLLHKPSLSLDIIQFIKERMEPVELVFGIGIGLMETGITKDSSIGSDGPAYWNARKMVERAKRKKPSICFSSNSLEDELINSLLLSSETIANSQTNKQKEIIKLYKQLGVQNKVAEVLGISQSAVSDALQKAFFKEIEINLKALKSFLDSRWV